MEEKRAGQMCIRDRYRINKYEMDFGGMAVPMEHDSYSAEVGVSQPIYAGRCV